MVAISRCLSGDLSSLSTGITSTDKGRAKRHARPVKTEPIDRSIVEQQNHYLLQAFKHKVNCFSSLKWDCSVGSHRVAPVPRHRGNNVHPTFYLIVVSEPLLSIQSLKKNGVEKMGRRKWKIITKICNQFLIILFVNGSIKIFSFMGDDLILKSFQNDYTFDLFYDLN